MLFHAKILKDPYKFKDDTPEGKNLNNGWMTNNLSLKFAWKGALKHVSFIVTSLQTSICRTIYLHHDKIDTRAKRAYTEQTMRENVVSLNWQLIINVFAQFSTLANIQKKKYRCGWL